MRFRFACIAVIVSAAFSTAIAAEHTKDTTDDVKKNLADGKAQLIDVREKGEWKDGHLKAAHLLPLSTLKKDPSQKDLDKVINKKKIVYLHCASGFRCLKAGDILAKHGYDVRPLKEGYSALVKAGFEKADK